MRKRYAVPGLRMFRLSADCGGKEVSVDFTGGRNNGYAVRPAQFTTGSEALQYIVEHSPEFKSGKIIRLGGDEG